MATRGQVRTAEASRARSRAAQIASHEQFPDEGGDGKHVAVVQAVNVNFGTDEKPEIRTFYQGERLPLNTPKAQIDRHMDLGSIAEAVKDVEPQVNLSDETPAQKKARETKEKKAADAAAKAEAAQAKADAEAADKAKEGEGPVVPDAPPAGELAGF